MNSGHSGKSGSVISFLFEDLDIRGVIVQLNGAWQDMHRGRNYAAPVRDLLGQVAAVGALIGANLKAPGRLTFQVQGHGPVSLLVVDCDERLQLRGMARTSLTTPATTPAAVSASELLGDGRLVLTLQSDAAAQPYQSFVPLEGDSIARIFEHYLSQSEQQPARLWLAADATQAAGLFLQTLPNAAERDPDGWNRIQQLASTLRPDELALPAETLLTRLFAEETIRLFAARPVSYHCPRDEDRVRAMLTSLGRDEVESILAEHGEIVVKDDICNHEYRFGADIVDQLFGSAKRTLH
jgi:molecular chaperone Hsp33